MSVTTLTPTRTRDLVLLGESDPVRRGGRRAVAMSECEFSLPDELSLDRCLAALRASDQRLAAQPDGPYDWKATWVERTPDGGGTVIFGVAWYDEAFFVTKKDVFLDPEHSRMFAEIGVPDGAFTVRHWHAA